MTRTRVLVVDDSPAFRALLVGILEGQPDLEVAGVAGDGVAAVEAVERLRPDVVTLDLEMPGPSGLDAIREIMRRRPTPIVVLSVRGTRGSSAVFEATSLGALAVLEKHGGLSRAGSPQREELATTLRLMARVPVGPSRRAGRVPADPPAPVAAAPRGAAVVAVGASAGGIPALARLLRDLPADGPPLLVVQHIAPGFAEGLATWLSERSRRPVPLGAAGAPLRAGVAYLAAPGRHLTVDPGGGRLALDDGPPVVGFRPSATVLFESVGRVFGARAVCVVLSGMGSDGADGVRTAASRGARILVQDPATAAVSGMPRAALEAAAAARAATLEVLAELVGGLSCDLPSRAG